MASFKLPIKVNLPDNWVDIVVEKLKKTKAFVYLLFGVKIANGLEVGCAINIVDDSDKPTENDFCSFAELKEEMEVK